MELIVLTMLMTISLSCTSQLEKGKGSGGSDLSNVETEFQIAEYVTSVFEDSKGNMWFGTLGKGIAKYDGEKLRYFTTADGLPSDRVTGIIEDTDGTFWLNTGEGLSKYDGVSFTNFLVGDSFASNMVSNLLIDSKDVFWIGTWNGVYHFDGENFHPFSIPYPEVDTKINEDTKNWITGLTEGPEGNIWIERDGYGICKYDGTSFKHLLKKDGLHSNNVTCIEFGKDGSVWIGTRVAERDNADREKRFGKGGVNKMMGKEIISFPEIKGFNDGDVYGIYKDKSEHIWISTTKNGLYRYDGAAFTHYDVSISVMGMLDDQKGNIWLGGAGGLYRITQDAEVVNVTTNGPWE